MKQVVAKSLRVEVRFSPSDYATLSSFADFQGQSISELIRTSVMDRANRWEDVDLAETVLDEIADGKQKIYTHKDAMAQIGLY